MQVLHGLLSSQDVELAVRLSQEKDLLAKSLEATKGKVVVKRPSNAPLLGEDPSLSEETFQRHSYRIEGPVNRWDVYTKSYDNTTR